MNTTVLILDQNISKQDDFIFPVFKCVFSVDVVFKEELNLMLIVSRVLVKVRWV